MEDYIVPGSIIHIEDLSGTIHKAEYVGYNQYVVGETHTHFLRIVKADHQFIEPPKELYTYTDSSGSKYLLIHSKLPLW